MPIKSENRARYPKNWLDISATIKTRAEGRCECEGQCGLHRTTPGPRRCTEVHGLRATWAKGKVVLTVHHLNFDPTDCHPENLRAMCQRCHLRCDLALHQRNSAKTRHNRKQNLNLFPDGT